MYVYKVLWVMKVKYKGQVQMCWEFTFWEFIYFVITGLQTPLQPDQDIKKNKDNAKKR